MVNDFSLDLTRVPKEFRLLLEIMKVEDDGKADTIDREWFTDINWDSFLELVMHHRVYPAIYLKVVGTDERLIPSYVVQTLYRYFKYNTFQMLHLSGEMEQVSKLFTENGIRTLFLKGPVLAADLYGDISLRTSSDLDVLVPLNDLGRVEELLLKLGYVKDDYIQTVLNDWKWRHHHITYFHPQKKIKLEIHWRLNPGPAKEPHFDELWKRKRRGSLTSYPVYFLGREDLFLFLVSHGARHGWSRLRWLVDIHQIVNQKFDVEKMNSLMRKYQFSCLVGQSLILISQLLGTSIPEALKRLTVKNHSRNLAQGTLFYFEKMVNLHTEPLPEEVARYHKHYLFSLKSNQQKFFFLISMLHPYPADAETLPLPKKLHFLYFPLRPILWAWRRTRDYA